jgi:heme/copper-type cytochrome/quinol oxidase subunit 3
MAIFIAAEIMFFAGLISAFLVLRAQAPDWPPMDQPRLPVGVTGFNTALLILSGWTMHLAATSLRGSRTGVVRWLKMTALLGALFLAIQGYEWVRLINFGLTTSSSLYGSTFYTLVGAHGLHVLAALIALLWAIRLGVRNRLQAESTLIEPFRMYWLFVVAVWPVLYVLVYLG